MNSSAAPAASAAPATTAPTASQIAFRKAFQVNLELARRANLGGKPRRKLGQKTIPPLTHDVAEPARDVAKPPCDVAKPAHGVAKAKKHKKWYQQQVLFSSDATENSPLVRDPYPSLNVSGLAARRLVFPNSS